MSFRSLMLKHLWSGYLLASIAVGAALGVRTALEPMGSFYYLPMVPAVMATAILADRRATAFAIALCIIANVLLVQRDSPLDTAINAALFAGVTWGIAEICWRLRAYQHTADEFAHRLARQARMLDTILKSVPVVVLNRAGSIGFLTPPACALLGASQAMAIGQPFSKFVEDFDAPSAFAPGESEGDASERVWIGRRGDGRRIPLSIQLGLMAEAAEGDYATLCLTDLSQSHAADARARDLTAQLNHVWRLNSLGEMAASLSHELNQPLSAATTYLHASQLDVRRAGLMGESADRTIELAKAQVLRAGEIIRRMRELLSHETRSLGTERVSSMVADLGDLLRMLERAEGVSIEIQVDHEGDQVRAERIQFQQALLNLVRNAAEAVGDRPDRRVQVIGRAVSDDSYEIRVEDSGIGIPPDEMAIIFRPMITTKSGGMGLGLSVTRTIVESHGGVLTVEPSVLGGAAFSFQLSREREQETAL